MNVAILGAGGIAHTMAWTLAGMKQAGRPVELWAVGSRSLEKAQAFAAQEGVLHACGSYEDMLADPAIDLVYIATPHSHHAAHMKLCIEAGKAVLCEKAFTGNARQAEEILRLAEAKGVLVTEAIWTRYMPARKIIDDLIASGAIGEVRMIDANLGYQMDTLERILKPELAGGALLDLGVYALNFASMVLGDDVVCMESSAQLFPTGTDKCENITLHYRGGQMAALQATSAARTSRRGCITGTEGAIIVDNINNPQMIEVYSDLQANIVRERIAVPKQITGYEYEVESCLRALENGALECPEMPHAQTIHMMRLMDELRRSWGVRYPFD